MTSTATGTPPHDDERKRDAESSTPAPTRTPLYQAHHSVRYHRQSIIKRIQDRTGRALLCYVCGSRSMIDRDDTVGFVDLLHNIRDAREVDLLLHTGGGDIDAAEKLITMVRRTVGNASIRAIVPDYAKSAGTLMVLGADEVVMSDTSELGPIDPQINLADGNGNIIRHSIQNYLDAYDVHTAKLGANPSDVAARIMLSKLDPATVKLFESFRDRATRLAEALLSRGMLRISGGNCTQIAKELMDTKKWQSHNMMISWEDAQEIGLRVNYVNPHSDEWQDFWQLSCMQRLDVRDKQKIFESEYVSLPIDDPTR